MTVSNEAAELLKEWQTGSLRVTAFHVGALDLNSVRWWEDLTRQPSESRNVRAGLGQLVEVGAIESRVLQLQIQPGRIDWLLLPKDENERFPTLGDYEKSLSYFSELVFKWLAEAPSLNRLAFGALLLIPTADQSRSNERLAQILQDVTINWEGIQDFVIQVNRPQACAALPDAGPINRVVKWQSLVRRKIVATLLPTVQVPVATEETAVSLELDMSTVASTDATKALPSERLKSLLGELMDHATDIAARRILP
jgi:hypothetical protein